MPKASMSSFKPETLGIAPRPTAEQEQCLAYFGTGKDLAINAGAGAGKTSTLVMMAKSTRRHGLYTAFNKALVEEARSKFPSNVIVSTAHSLAYRAIVPGKRADGSDSYKHRIPGGYSPAEAAARMKLGVLAECLRITVSKPYQRYRADKVPVVLEPWRMAAITKEAIERFCQSADDAVKPSHFPWQKGLSKDGNAALRSDLTDAATRFWKDIENPKGSLPFSHACYLKLYELRDPHIEAEFILIDEAQDLSPVLISILQQQHHAQLVFVGDENQQIYEFTGAINALKKIKTTHRAQLSQSFRFGDPIAAPANDVLALIPGNTMRIRGFGSEGFVGPVENPCAVLTRTNATAVEALLTSPKKIHVVGGGDDVQRFCWAAADLQEGKKTTHQELSCFDTWQEVQTYVEEGGDDLKLLVTLIDRFGAKRIAMALRNMPSIDEADVIYSTAHKAKGLEFESVQIASDFVTTKRCTCECTMKQHTEKDGEYGECFNCDECRMFVSRGITPSEARLLYVAITRAKRRLDLGAMMIGPDGIEMREEKEELERGV